MYDVLDHRLSVLEDKVRNMDFCIRDVVERCDKFFSKTDDNQSELVELRDEIRRCIGCLRS